MKDWHAILFLFIGSFALAYLMLTHFFIKIRVIKRLENTTLKKTPKRQGYNWLKVFSLTLSEKVLKITPENLRRKVQDSIIRSGVNWSLQDIVLLKTLLTIIGVIMGFILSQIFGKANLALIFMILVAAGGFSIPDFVLARKSKKRQKEIYQMLPSFVDYLTITIEAGLGLDLAMTKVISKLHGPLAESLANALTEMKYGKSRSEALKNMSSQVDIPELTSLVNALTSGEKFGIGIGSTLRTQGQQLREKRTQRIQEQAFKIPVKLVFPLVLFILPGLFIVLLGPAAIQVTKSLF